MPRKVSRTTQRTKAKSKAKVKIKRTRAMYTCISKNALHRVFITERLNQHGAKDNVNTPVIVYEIQFGYSAPPTFGVIPALVSAHYNYVTTVQEIADKYNVGNEYESLPS